MQSEEEKTGEVPRIGQNVSKTPQCLTIQQH